jgi:hypothetical protein
MVLDPIFADFNEGERIEKIMYLIGGTPPKLKRKSNAKTQQTEPAHSFYTHRLLYLR